MGFFDSIAHFPDRVHETFHHGGDSIKSLTRRTRQTIVHQGDRFRRRTRSIIKTLGGEIRHVKDRTIATVKNETERLRGTVTDRFTNPVKGFIKNATDLSHSIEQGLISVTKGEGSIGKRINLQPKIFEQRSFWDNFYKGFKKGYGMDVEALHVIVKYVNKIPGVNVGALLTEYFPEAIMGIIALELSNLALQKDGKPSGEDVARLVAGFIIRYYIGDSDLADRVEKGETTAMETIQAIYNSDMGKLVRGRIKEMDSVPDPIKQIL